MANTVSFNSNYPNISRSQELFARAEKRIPCQTQMLAKGPQQHTKGVAPIYLESGRGSHVWDVDGNEYLDLTMGMGPMSLGYTYARVDDAIRTQLNRGINFTLNDQLEVKVAELFHEFIPNAEMVRYSKSGADVTSAAVRLARAHTGRDQVICCGYHGWHDWYIGQTSRHLGVPRSVAALTTKIGYNDLDALKSALTPNTACFILEPVVFQEPDVDYLQTVKELCEKNGTLLIFDEIWSGFRIALGGAQEFFGVEADLATFSKACANGMPIAALVGREEIMRTMEREDFFCFTTFGGEALSLAATEATLLEMKEKNVPAIVSKRCAQLRDGFNEIADGLGMKAGMVRAVGLDYRSMIMFDGSAAPKVQDPLKMKSLLQQELIKRGVLWTGFHHVSFSHTEEDLLYALRAYADVLPILKQAVDEDQVEESLRGEPVHAVFRNLGIGQH